MILAEKSSIFLIRFLTFFWRLKQNGLIEPAELTSPPLYSMWDGSSGRLSLQMKPSAIKPQDLAKSGGSGSVFLDILGELAVEVRFGHFEIVLGYT